MQNFEEIKKRFNQAKTEFSNNVKDEIGEHVVQNYFEPILNSLNHLVRLEQAAQLQCKGADVHYTEAVLIMPNI